MNDSSQRLGAEAEASTEVERLDSWKEIASHLDRTVRTAQRWEKNNGLPVHRQRHEIGATVFAYRHELDEWLAERTGELDDDPIQASAQANDDEVGTAPPANEAADDEAAGRAQGRWIPFVLGVMAILAVVLGIVLLRPVVRSTDPEPTVPRWLTTSTGVERTPALSPDGRQVAYIWDGDNGHLDLYVRLVEAGAPLRITRGSAIEESPAWSPDGVSIAFLRRTETEGQREIRIVPALGGEERLVAETTVPVNFDRARVVGAAVDWSPDGRWIVATERIPESDSAGLIAIDVRTGARTLLTDPGVGITDAQPTFAPDGTRLAFLRSHAFNYWTLHVLELEPGDTLTVGKQTDLPAVGNLVSHPVWTPEGGELVFARGRWGLSSLWRVSTDDGAAEPRPLGSMGVGGSEPTLVALPETLDGRDAGWRLVYAARELDNDLWRLTLPAPGSEGESAAIADLDADAERLIGSSQRERFPAYSPDGSRIVFGSDRTGYREYWVANSDGTSPTQWTDWQSTYIGIPVWSPDSTRIAYTVRIGGEIRAYVQDRPLQPPLQLEVPGAVRSILAWAREGETVYVSSTQDASLPTIWAADATGERPARSLLQLDGHPLGEDPSRRFLFLEFGDGTVRSVGRVPIDGGPGATVETLIQSSLSPVVGPDGLYAMIEDNDGVSVVRWSYDEERAETVARLDETAERGLSVSPDGRHLLLSRVGLLRSDLLVVDGLK